MSTGEGVAPEGVKGEGEESAYVIVWALDGKGREGGG